MRRLVLQRLSQRPFMATQPSVNVARVIASRQRSHALPRTGPFVSLLDKQDARSPRPLLFSGELITTRTHLGCRPRPLATLSIRMYSAWFASRSSESSSGGKAKKDSEERHDRSSELILKMLEPPKDGWYGYAKLSCIMLSVGVSVYVALAYSWTRSADELRALITENGFPSRAALEAKYREQRALSFDRAYQIILALLPPLHMPPSAHELTLRLKDWYTTLPPCRSAVVPILIINTGVFMICRRRALTLAARPLHEVFTYRNLCLTAFRHTSFGHFLFVQTALWTLGSYCLEPSFTDPIDLLCSKIDSTWHFTGFYLLAAVTARTYSMTPWLMRQYFAREAYRESVLGRPKLKSLNTEWWRLFYRKSLALGPMGGGPVVYALLGLGATTPTETRVQIPLLSRDVSYQKLQMSALSTLCLFDLFCLLSGRMRFDHAAHLVGAVFGLTYDQAFRWNEDRALCLEALNKALQRQPGAAAAVSNWYKAETEAAGVSAGEDSPNVVVRREALSSQTEKELDAALHGEPAALRTEMASHDHM